MPYMCKNFFFLKKRSQEYGGFLACFWGSLISCAQELSFYKKGQQICTRFPSSIPLKKGSSTISEHGNAGGLPLAVVHPFAEQLNVPTQPLLPQSLQTQPRLQAEPFARELLSSEFQQKNWRSPAHPSTSLPSFLTRELSDGGWLLNFRASEPCTVQSEVNRFLRPEGAS